MENRVFEAEHIEQMCERLRSFVGRRVTEKSLDQIANVFMRFIEVLDIKDTAING